MAVSPFLEMTSRAYSPEGGTAIFFNYARENLMTIAPAVM